MSQETPDFTTLSAEDVKLMKSELEGTSKPLSLKFLTQRLAFEKTASQRSQAVKRYDPYANYEIGDFIYKEYDEALTVGSKSVEHFKGGVVLTVVSKVHSDHFNCEMLGVDYPGGGLFRKYLDYMKKTRTQVLLPSNLEGRNQKPEIMSKDDDPRLTELPMTERDLRNLGKNLRSQLAKDPDFFNWNELWQLSAKQLKISEAKVKTIEKDLAQTRQSVSTEDLVGKLFGLEPSHDLFEMHCLSLAFTLDKKFKKEFILLTNSGWGRWHLKKILNSFPDKLPLSAARAKLPEVEEIEKPEMSTVQSFPIKIYLGWREILSGGIRIPRGLNRELARTRELIFTDTEDGRTYTLYYYPTQNFFLGLRDFYQENNIPQGTSLTLEKSGPNTFNFWIKKSKKKISVPCLEYDAAKDEILDSGEETFSFAEPNKIIYIDRDNLTRILALYEQRADLDLKDLLMLVFKDPALAPGSHSLHFLRAYHLIDILRPTTQEDVEFTLLNAEEFSKSEKKKGIFFYQEPYVPVEEEEVEIPVEEIAIPVEELPAEEVVPAEELPEAEPVEVPERAAEQLVQPGPPPVKEKRPAPAAPPKKEKPPKKKKPKPEGERGPRPRKSERRVIEEKIEEEESVLEALSAIKEAEEEAEEIRAKDQKEEFKPEPKAEEPKFGVFAEMLKTALKKKDEKEPEPEEKKKTKKKDE